MSHSFDDKRGVYDWGTYIHGSLDKEELEHFLGLLKKYLYLEDDLDECYALDHHWDADQMGRSMIGELVYRAKYQDDETSAKQLADLFVEFVEAHPLYKRVDAVVAVPSSTPNKHSNIPSIVASTLAKAVGLSYKQNWVLKVRSTRQQKNIHTAQEKVENVAEAFDCTDVAIRDQSILIVDDLYQSGATINEVGRTLRQRGARAVRGLVATKTHHNV